MEAKAAGKSIDDILEIQEPVTPAVTREADLGPVRPKLVEHVRPTADLEAQR